MFSGRRVHSSTSRTSGTIRSSTTSSSSSRMSSSSYSVRSVGAPTMIAGGSGLLTTGPSLLPGGMVVTSTTTTTTSGGGLPVGVTTLGVPRYSGYRQVYAGGSSSGWSLPSLLRGRRFRSGGVVALPALTGPRWLSSTAAGGSVRTAVQSSYSSSGGAIAATHPFFATDAFGFPVLPGLGAPFPLLAPGAGGLALGPAPAGAPAAVQGLAVRLCGMAGPPLHPATALCVNFAGVAVRHPVASFLPGSETVVRIPLPRAPAGAADAPPPDTRVLEFYLQDENNPAGPVYGAHKVPFTLVAAACAAALPFQATLQLLPSSVTLNCEIKFEPLPVEQVSVETTTQSSSGLPLPGAPAAAAAAAAALPPHLAEAKELVQVVDAVVSELSGLGPAAAAGGVHYVMLQGSEVVYESSAATPDARGCVAWDNEPFRLLSVPPAAPAAGSLPPLQAIDLEMQVMAGLPGAAPALLASGPVSLVPTACGALTTGRAVLARAAAGGAGDVAARIDACAQFLPMELFAAPEDGAEAEAAEAASGQAGTADAPAGGLAAVCDIAFPAVAVTDIQDPALRRLTETSPARMLVSLTNKTPGETPRSVALPLARVDRSNPADPQLIFAAPRTEPPMPYQGERFVRFALELGGASEVRTVLKSLWSQGEGGAEASPFPLQRSRKTLTTCNSSNVAAGEKFVVDLECFPPADEFNCMETIVNLPAAAGAEVGTPRATPVPAPVPVPAPPPAAAVAVPAPAPVPSTPPFSAAGFAAGALAAPRLTTLRVHVEQLRALKQLPGTRAVCFVQASLRGAGGAGASAATSAVVLSAASAAEGADIDETLELPYNGEAVLAVHAYQVRPPDHVLWAEGECDLELAVFSHPQRFKQKVVLGDGELSLRIATTFGEEPAGATPHHGASGGAGAAVSPPGKPLRGASGAGGAAGMAGKATDGEELAHFGAVQPAN